MDKPGLLYIGNKLATKGNTVTSIETLGSFLEQDGYTVYFASSKKNKALRLIDMLLSVIRYRTKVSTVLIDTYSTQNFFYAVAVANLCRLIKLPYVPILRGGNLPERLKTNKAACWKLFNGAKVNVAPSAYLMNEFQQYGYSNLVHIPNTIELDNYPFKKRSILEPKLLWVRSFAAIYNPEMALDIIGGLRNRSINAELCMVGPDKDGSLDRCRKISEERKLDVTFTGRLTKKEWISRSENYDIFINTTNFDNTPVSVIEAMALGLPVVSTDVGGIPYLLEDGINARLLPPNQSENFVDVIDEFLNSPELVERITTNARAKVSQFDWKIVRRNWDAILSA